METIMEAEEAYRGYITEHVNNIKTAYELVEGQLQGIFWLDELTMSVLDNRVKLHDESKISTEEFHGYRLKFYPCKQDLKDGWKPELIQEEFAQSWLHHKNRNDHHPEFWMLHGNPNRPLEMSFQAMFEMLLDWTAMSLKSEDTPGEFWEKNRFWIPMHEKTQQAVGRWIAVFDRAVGCISGLQAGPTRDYTNVE